MKLMRKAFVVSLILSCALPVSCATRERMTDRAGRKRITIGLLLESADGQSRCLNGEWLIKKANIPGVDVLIRYAEGRQEEQNRQASELVGEGADILVVLPPDPETAASIVVQAHQAGIPVLAWGDLIMDADLDLYVAADREAAGYLQAQALLEKSSGGESVLLGGGESDPNARLVRAGQLRAFEERAEKIGEEIPMLADLYLDPPTREEARRRIASLLDDLKTVGRPMGAIMAFSDEIAAGAIAALKEKRPAGPVFVAGRGATLPACRRIIEGTQTVTVYIPSPRLAAAAIRAAVRLARGMKPEAVIRSLDYQERSVDNGYKEVPAILLEPVVVSRANMIETVVLDGRYPVEEIYQK